MALFEAERRFSVNDIRQIVSTDSYMRMEWQPGK